MAFYSSTWISIGFALACLQKRIDLANASYAPPGENSMQEMNLS